MPSNFIHIKEFKASTGLSDATLLQLIEEGSLTLHLENNNLFVDVSSLDTEKFLLKIYDGEDEISITQREKITRRIEELIEDLFNRALTRLSK